MWAVFPPDSSPDMKQSHSPSCSCQVRSALCLSLWFHSHMLQTFYFFHWGKCSKGRKHTVNQDTSVRQQCACSQKQEQTRRLLVYSKCCAVRKPAWLAAQHWRTEREKRRIALSINNIWSWLFNCRLHRLYMHSDRGVRWGWQSWNDLSRHLGFSWQAQSQGQDRFTETNIITQNLEPLRKIENTVK